MRRLITLLVLTVGVAGCGGDDQKQIRATFRDLREAVQRQDFARVCALMTDRAQREQIKNAANADAKTCVEAWEPPSSRDGFQAVQAIVAMPPPIQGIDVSGHRARVQHVAGPPTVLRKVDGRWLFD